MFSPSLSHHPRHPYRATHIYTSEFSGTNLDSQVKANRGGNGDEDLVCTADSPPWTPSKNNSFIPLIHPSTTPAALA